MLLRTHRYFQRRMLVLLLSGLPALAQSPTALPRPVLEHIRLFHALILNPAKALARAQSGEMLPVTLVTNDHKATLKYLRENLPNLLHKQRLCPEQSFVLLATGPSGPLSS